MMEAKEGSCFFCLQRQGTVVFSLKPPAKWPAPLPPGTGLAMCGLCAASLTMDQIAEAVREHINNLLKIHNRRMAESAGRPSEN